MKKFSFIIVLLFLSCTKEIDINLPNSGSQLIINGNIESGEPAKILLSRSLPYFDPLNINNVFGSFVYDAEIKITSSDGESEFLTPTPIFGVADTWYYNYIGSDILGQENVSYTLEVAKGDTLLYATTTIPKLAPITRDSLRFLYRVDDSSYCYLLGHLKDPDELGNCYRIFSKTKSIWGSSFDMAPPINGYDDFYISMLEQDGNFNDEYVNGWEFSFPTYKGRGFWQEWGQQELNNEEEVDGSSGATTGFWNVGDTVILKWSSVDRSSWDFWYSLAFNNPAGPFGAPSDAKSNVDGGLGVFGGTSSQKIKLIADPEAIEPIIDSLYEDPVF